MAYELKQCLPAYVMLAVTIAAQGAATTLRGEYAPSAGGKLIVG